MVNTFIDNLQPRYKNHLKFIGLESFDKVYKIGIRIENEVMKEGTKNKWTGNKNTNTSSPSKGVSSINNVETTQPNKPAYRRQKR
jgi:hypothetical protein